MACRWITTTMPDGTKVTAHVCGIRAPKPKPCSRCGRPSTKQCDYPLRGKKAGKLCDKHLCEVCAVPWGDDVDYCPPHADMACKDARVISCDDCGNVAPRCNRCLDSIEEQLAGVAAVRGELWGASVRNKKHGGEWPSWDDVRSVPGIPGMRMSDRVRAIARQKMADVAGDDEKLLERLARRCAAAAARAYGGK